MRRAAAAVAQKMVTINIASKTVVTFGRTKKTNQSTIDGDDNSNGERSGLGSKSPGSKLI